MRYCWFALAVILTNPVLGRAGEDYFVLMFGSQRVPSNPNYSHTFATFVKASWPGEGPRPANPRLEICTISWLPANGVVRTHALLSECGRNFELHETMRWNLGNCMRTSLWGPYRICPELYQLALKQAALLESGQVRYKADDTGHSSERVSNCIHAASSVVEGNRLRVASPGWGEMASYDVLRRYEPFVIDKGTVHPWVGIALGLDAYPIIYRDWQSPRSGFFGPVNRALGGERNLHASYGPPDR